MAQAADFFYIFFTQLLFNKSFGLLLQLKLLEALATNLFKFSI